MPDTTSTRPYLIRAIREWILDNGLTPHILVNARAKGASVPEQYVKDGKITFNVSHSAAKDLVLGNEEIEFDARFRGAPVFVRIPTEAVLAVYAKETGAGTAFQEISEEAMEEERAVEDAGSPEEKDPPSKPPASGGAKPERPALRIVK